jgi:two-component system sensor histidine kinase/response regulator
MNTKAHILVIDDEESLCITLTDLLFSYGFEADYATTSDLGLSFLTKNPDTDIVLLDLNLGSGRSGVEILSVIRARHPYVQIVVLTSEHSLDTGLECMKAGAYDYLTKPFAEQRFFEIVPGALERKHILQLNDVYLEILVHDLKNPLQNIILPVESLVSSPDVPEGIRERLRVAQFGCRQINAMVNNILTVSQFEEKKLVSDGSGFTLKDEVETRLGVLFHNIVLNERAYTLELPGPDDLRIKTEPDIFFQVVWNIAHNALRHTPVGETIAIVFSKTRDSMIEVKVTNPGSYIEERFREKIFDKYATMDLRREHVIHNYGLGLTFCKLAVEALGGSIEVSGKREPPETTFRFTVRDHS